MPEPAEIQAALIALLGLEPDQTAAALRRDLHASGIIASKRLINRILYSERSFEQSGIDAERPTWRLREERRGEKRRPPANGSGMGPEPEVGSFTGSDSSRPHGSACSCGELTLDCLSLSADRVRQLARWLKKRGPATLAGLERHLVFAAADLGGDIAFEAHSALTAFRAADCPTGLESVPLVGWRTYVRPGHDSPGDLWPDEWDGVTWSDWARGTLDLDASLAAGWAIADGLMHHTAYPQARRRTRRELAEYSLANRGDLWIDSDSQWDVATGWSRDDTARLLLSARSQWEPQQALVRDIARSGNRREEEVIAYWQYLRQCDQGLSTPDDLVRRLLMEFPPQRPELLLRRVRMLDRTSIRGEVEVDLLEDDPELLDALDPPIVLPSTQSEVAADGGPDPLALVRTLLPGGEGTRGRPPIVYTETLLDKVLLPDIVARAPTLIILSGNAGDGKTAFIAQVLVASGATYSPGTNEYHVEIGHKPYLVVLDGSEDAESRTNESLLLDALGEFRGEEPRQPERGTLIAINKGRLLGFLETHDEQFPYLWSVVRQSLVVGGEIPKSPYEIVDLNERTTIGPEREASIFTGMLERFTEWTGWDQECSRCDAMAQCPVLFNVRLMRTDLAREQMWRVLAAVDLDDRLHVTARHVVTKLASAVVGDKTCSGIRATVRRGGHFDGEAFVYNRLFAADDPSGSVHEASAMDRAASGYDPSEVSSPRRDRRFAFRLVRGALNELIGGDAMVDSQYLVAAASRIEESSIDEKPGRGEREYRLQLLDFIGDLSRRLFLSPGEGTGQDLAPIFPVRTLDHYVDILNGGVNLRDTRQQVIEHLNATLGVEKARLTELLAPRDYARGLVGRGLAAILPADVFELVPVTKLGARFDPPAYVEAWPRALALIARDDGQVVATLTIPLLLFEVLARAGRGFRPTTQTERGFMVRVASFYRRLAEHRWTVMPNYALYDNGQVVGRAVLEPSKIIMTELL